LFLLWYLNQSTQLIYRENVSRSCSDIYKVNAKHAVGCINFSLTNCFHTYALMFECVYVYLWEYLWHSKCCFVSRTVKPVNCSLNVKAITTCVLLLLLLFC